MSSKAQKKAGFELPDPVTGYELLDVCLKIPDAPEYRRAFLGHLYKLGLWAIWEKSYLPDDTRAKEAGELWRETLNAYLDMGCNDMNCCCDDPPAQFRYSSAGVLQRSTDGGTTWTDAPGFDPRINSPQFPPMSGADGIDKKCIAATGMAHLIKTQIADTMTEDMGVYDLQELIRDWTGLAINSGANIFQILITIAVNQILALGILLIQAALTEGVYDTLKCIFYCNMGDDASFSQAQLEQVTTDMGDQIGGIATLFLQQLVNLLGSVGLTNLARSGGATVGDCSDCTECAEARVYFTNGIAGMTEVFPDELGVYTVTCNSFASGGYYGNLQFTEDVVADGYNTCNNITVLTVTGGDVSVKQVCHTGENNYLSTCYALMQWYSGSAWTMTFEIGEPCT